MMHTVDGVAGVVHRLSFVIDDARASAAGT